MKEMDDEAKRVFGEQKVGVLNEYQAGVSLGDLCNKQEVSDVIFYK